MDQQTRDWYLARWLVSRGVCSEAQVTYVFQQAGDFTQNLQNASILHPQLWQLFLRDMESRGSSITPPSQSTMLRAFRDESKLPKIGDHFAGYELLTELGRGGMGAVFKARRLSDQKIFALKMILAGENASEEHRERFRREIDAMRKLQHPNIAQVYDSGSADQIDFYTMDHIEQGRSLSKAVIDEEWGLLQGIDLLSEVALALHYAHEQGVIHRDIKPSNIVVDGDKKPWIVDFGLVRELDRVTKLTQSGAFLGTPSYMSPEQCVESSKVDARSDVYALGAILYEILAGRKPFESQSATALMAEILNKLPEPPSKLGKNVDPRLEAISLKALAKDPGKRYQTAKDFAEDLQLARQGQRVSAQRSKKPWVIGAILLSLIVCAIGALWVMSENDENVLADSLLEAKARRWAPKLKALEKKLDGPGAVKISELADALALPSQSRFENGQMPKMYRVLLGRLACLEGEVALRLGDLERARGSLKVAEEHLQGQSDSKRLLTLKTLIEINEDRLTYEQAIEFLGRLLILKKQRGDLLLLRARLHWKSKNFTSALFDIEQAEMKGFLDPRLKCSVLSSKGQFEEAVLIIEKSQKWTYRPEDRIALFRAGSKDLKQKEHQRGLKRFQRCLDELKDERLRWKLRDFLWAIVKEETNEKAFRNFQYQKTMDRFLAIAAFIDEHFGRDGMPKGIPRNIGYLVANLDGLKGDFDLRCFKLYEQACRWGRDDPTLWLRMTSEVIAETVPTAAYRRLIPHRRHCLSLARSESERIQFQAQFQRLYFYSMWFQQGLNEIPKPTDKELESNPSWAADWCYWRGFSYRRLGKLDDCLRVLRRAPKGFGEHVREINYMIGEILIDRGQLKKGIDSMLYGGRDLNSSSKSKWQFLFRKICLHSHNYPESVSKFAALLRLRDSSNRYKDLVGIWQALNESRWADAEKLIFALAESLKRKKYKKRLLYLLSVVKNPKYRSVPSTPIRRAFISAMEGA